MSAEATKNLPVAENLQDGAKPVREGEELDLVRLEPYLRRHFPDLGGALIGAGVVGVHAAGRRADDRVRQTGG